MNTSDNPEPHIFSTMLEGMPSSIHIDLGFNGKHVRVEFGSKEPTPRFREADPDLVEGIKALLADRETQRGGEREGSAHRPVVPDGRPAARKGRGQHPW